MAEEENVAEAVQHEEVIQPQEQVAPTSQSPEVEAQPNDLSDKERNFQRMREKTARLEREKAELQNALEAQENPTDTGVASDELVEGKHLQKLYQEIEKVKNAAIPDRLRSKFPDFDQVVTKENVEKLKQSEPELFVSIKSGDDLYAKGVSAYKTLRALGIAKDDPYKAQKEQVHQNQSRPLSTQAIKGQGALSEANIFAKGLTPELKKQLQQEMAQAVKAR